MNPAVLWAGVIAAALTYYVGHATVQGVQKVMGKTKQGIVRIVHPHKTTHPELLLPAHHQGGE